MSPRATSGTTARAAEAPDSPPPPPPDGPDAPTKPSAEVKLVRNWFACCSFHASPPWMQDNQYILDGYRVAVPSKRFAFLTIFRVHNETMNIWTHLVGFLMFVWFTVLFASEIGAVKMAAMPAGWHALLPRLDRAVLLECLQAPAVGATAQLAAARTAAMQALEAQAGSLSDRFVHLHETLSETLKHDAEAVNSLIQHVHTHLYPTELAARWPFYVFLVGAMVCLLASTVCHTMHCISQRFSSLIWRLDYVGIVALISCSYFPVIHYCFQCLPTIRAVYLGTVVVLASGCILVSSVEVFQENKYMPFRAAVFTGLGVFGFVPVIHQSFFTWDHMPTPVRIAMGHLLVMGACYLTGVALFVLRFPERLSPGRFDLWLHSHNLFHMLVVAGAVLHYHASLVLLRWRDHQSCVVDDHMLFPFYLTQ